MRKAIVTLVVVLIVVTIGLGFYRDWFNFSTKRNAQGDDKVTLSLEVDRGKIKQDIEAAKQKVKEIGRTGKENVEALAGAATEKGTVVNVEEAGQRFTLMTADNKQLAIQMDSSSQVHLREAERHLKDLRAGDRVTVVYKVNDGKNIAQSVTIERAA
jgi:hypothetical protein